MPNVNTIFNNPAKVISAGTYTVPSGIKIEEPDWLKAETRNLNKIIYNLNGYEKSRVWLENSVKPFFNDIKNNTLNNIKTGDFNGIGTALDFASNLIGKDYSGKKAGITSAMDDTTKIVSDAAMMIPGGQVVGTAVKAATLASRASQEYLGTGTDKMTTGDAILGSDLLGFTMPAMINGWTGSETLNLNLDQDVLANSSYTGTADEIMDAKGYAGKKYGGFSGGARRKANRKIRQAKNRQFGVRGIMDEYSDQQDIVNSSTDMLANNYQLQRSGYFNNQPIHMGKSGMKISDRIAAYKSKRSEQLNKPKNLIPDGALHARKNHIDSEYHITHKGVPVIMEDGGKTQQVAEIESGEIVFNLDVTKKIEELYKKYNSEEDKDSIALEAGKLIAKEILYNTDDRLDLINNVE